MSVGTEICITCSEYYGNPYCSSCDPKIAIIIHDLSVLPVDQCINLFQNMDSSINSLRIQRKIIIQRMTEFFKYCMEKIHVRKYIIIDNIACANILRDNIRINDILDLAQTMEGQKEYPKIFFTAKITNYLLDTYNGKWTNMIWMVQHLLTYHTLDQMNCDYSGVYGCYYGTHKKTDAYVSGYNYYSDLWCQHNLYLYATHDKIPVLTNYALTHQCDICNEATDEIYFCNGCNTIYHKKCYDNNIITNAIYCDYLDVCNKCTSQIKSAYKC